MKQYNVGRGYLVLTDAAKYIANKIGKGKDEKVISKIYKEFKQRIKENRFQYEHHGKRIVKVKRSYLDTLIDEFKGMFLEYQQLSLVLDDTKTEVKDGYELKNHDNKEEIGKGNIGIIKDLLQGKYDNMVDEEVKKKLIQKLIDEK